MTTKTSPSVLPFIAACPCYVSGQAATPEARRGTAIHKAIRELWEARNGMTLFSADDILESMSKKDREAVMFGIDTLDFFASKGEKIYTSGDAIKAAGVPGINDGEMDACAPELQLVIEFKTGQHCISYDAQTAAYALACMRKYGKESWAAATVHLDARRVEVCNYTRAEAEHIVRQALTQPKIPRPGITCNMCGYRACKNCR